jgi:hypothetical protein
MEVVILPVLKPAKRKDEAVASERCIEKSKSIIKKSN